MIPKRDSWGPFAPDLDPCERRAGLRSLRAIVRLNTGPRGHDLDRTLRAAEDDDSLLEWCVILLNALEPLDRRKVWNSYASLTAPERLTA